MEDGGSGGKSRNGRAETLSIQSPEEAPHDYAQSSAHATDTDSWQQVGALLVTSFNCGVILAFSNLMVAPLGWGWGAGCLLSVAALTAYANWLLADFHYLDGRRFIRYRDLMGFLFGREMYYVTWVFQFLALILTNMGTILLGARALKEMDSEVRESPLRLQYFAVITGAAYCFYSFLVPTVSAMKNWLGISAILTLLYIVPVMVILVRDACTAGNTRDYDIKGSSVGKVFDAFGAISIVIFCNTSGMLPEIQSTLRRPAVKNMKKALAVQFSAGLLIYYAVTVGGYWAYGSAVSEYLPKHFSAAPKWLNLLLNTAVFLQSAISQHVFIAPVHEALDTKFLHLHKNMYSPENIWRRFLLRALLFTVNTLAAAALPFMGDFMNLIGSFMLVPLTLTFPSMIFIKVKGHAAGVGAMAWHRGLVVFSILLAAMTTISAVRFIVNHVRDYQLFADT